MTDSLSILIRALLEQKSKENIISEINQIQNTINKNPLKLKINIDGKEFKELSANIQKLNIDLSKNLSMNNLGGLDKYTEKFTKGSIEATERIKEYKNQLGESVKVVEKLDAETKQWSESTKTVVSNYAQQQKSNELEAKKLELLRQQGQEYSKNASLALENISNKYSYGDQTQLNNLKQELNKGGNFQSLEGIPQQIQSYDLQIKKITSDLKISHEQNLSLINEEIAKEQLSAKERLNNENLITQAKMKQGNAIDQSIAIREAEGYKNSALLKEQMQAAVQDKNRLDTEKQQTAELEKQIALFQKNSQLKIDNILSNNGKYASTETKSSLTQLSDELKTLDASAPNVKQRMQDISFEIKKLSSDSDNAARSSLKLGDSFATAAIKMAEWTVVGTAIFGTIREIEKGVQSVIELNTNLTQTATAMNTTVDKLGAIASGAQQMSKNMGANINDVLQIMHVYANVNETADSIIKKTKADVILSNLTGMSGQETTETLQALQQSFNLTDDQLMHVDDSLTKIASNLRMNYQTAIKEIGEGVKTTGTMAQQAGLSFEQFSSIIAATMEKTRRSGSEIANSMKMIFARVGQIKSPDVDVTGEDQSKAAQALQSIGVDVIDRQTNQLRNMYDILGDVAAKWDSLSANQKAYVSDASAGKMCA